MVRIRDDVSRMLRVMCSKSRSLFLEASTETFPPEFQEQQPSDYSSGTAMFFTKGGGRLRPWVKCVRVGKGAKSDPAKCIAKSGWRMQQTKKRQWHGDGAITFLCAKSRVVLGIVLLDSAEGRSSGVAALHEYRPYSDHEWTIVNDTPCMTASFIANRLPGPYSRLKLLGDRLHLPPHKCKLIYNPDDFSFMDGENLSLVEQWHAVVDALALTIQRMTLDHAMFSLLLLAHDRYDEICDNLGVPESRRSWPDDDTELRSSTSGPHASVTWPEASTDSDGIDYADENTEDFFEERCFDEVCDGEGDDWLDTNN